MNAEAKHVGKYELQTCLGQDNVTEVWKAFDSQFQRYVIIKLLKTSLQDTAHVEAEIQKIKSLHHPNLLPIQDIKVAPSASNEEIASYIVMEYIEGQTLADYIHSKSQQKKLAPISEIISIFSAICGAVSYAHQKGIHDCNVKATHILLDKQNTSKLREGEPVLVNYEIATLLGTSSTNENTDLYLLGVLLYELCTGVSPFHEVSAQGEKITTVHPITRPESFNRRISPALSQVIMRSLAQNRADRFPSVAALISAAVDALKEISVSLTPSASPPVISSPQLSPVRKRSRLFIALTALLILLVAGMGTLFGVLQNKPAPLFAANQIVGHATFESSGQFVDNSTNGINDELHLILSNIPNPAPGKSYYLWLLSDANQKPTAFISLGTLPANHQNVDSIYTAPQHLNLIATTSRLLITEENSNPPPTSFSSNTRTWRYTAEIPQTSGPPLTNPLRFLRLIMVESNKMAAVGLHGGSAYWMLKNTQKVLEWAGSARDEWDLKNADLMHRHFIRILEYTDSLSFDQADLPTNTPVLVNPILAQYGLVTVVPGDNPEAYAPRVSYNIISFVETATHLSPDKRKLGLETQSDVRTRVEARLQLVRQDAKKLFLMTNDQLLQRSSLTLLNDMGAQARIAFSGELDPNAGYLKGGALNDYNNIHLIASMDVVPYTAK